MAAPGGFSKPAVQRRPLSDPPPGRQGLFGRSSFGGRMSSAPCTPMWLAPHATQDFPASCVLKLRPRPRSADRFPWQIAGRRSLIFSAETARATSRETGSKRCKAGSRMPAAPRAHPRPDFRRSGTERSIRNQPKFACSSTSYFTLRDLKSRPISMGEQELRVHVPASQRHRQTFGGAERERCILILAHSPHPPMASESPNWLRLAKWPGA